MAQITEDYCSFDIAKLLKEKGFDWYESPFYSEQDRDEWRQNNSYTVPNEEYDPDLPFDSETLTLVAPHVSIQMAMKWLRETYQIFIRISTDFLYPLKYYGEIFCYGDNLKTQQDVSTKKFESPEQAGEAAIKYCLENFI